MLAVYRQTGQVRRRLCRQYDGQAEQVMRRLCRSYRDGLYRLGGVCVGCLTGRKNVSLGNITDSLDR
jgi:hypothetical protein